jgi:hypothetical protein
MNDTSIPDKAEDWHSAIRDLQKQHLDDLEQLYEAQAQDYLQEAMDRYHSKDDSQFLMRGENNYLAKSSYAKLDVRMFMISQRRPY